jgi:hypothetical protein
MLALWSEEIQMIVSPSIYLSEKTAPRIRADLAVASKLQAFVATLLHMVNTLVGMQQRRHCGYRRCMGQSGCRVHGQTDKESTALKVADKKQRYQKNKMTIVSFKCGKPGHMKMNCLEWENKKRTDAAALNVTSKEMAQDVMMWFIDSTGLTTYCRMMCLQEILR